MPHQELIDMLPLDLGPDLNVNLGWDLIFSHEERFLYFCCAVARTSSTGDIISCSTSRVDHRDRAGHGIASAATERNRLSAESMAGR